MKFGNWMRCAALGLAFAGFATAADATVFKLDSLTFSGDAFSDPGLVVKTNSLVPQEFTLDHVGDTAWVDLFEIWSEEEYVDWGDTESRDFSVGLNFVLPAPPFGGTAPGESDGGFLLFGIIPIGVPTLQWDDNTLVFNFGELGDGLLQLTLFDTVFSYDCVESYGIQTFGGDHGDNGGSCRTTVKGKFELLADATEVPEPATLATLGLGLSALGLFSMRRRRAA